MFTSEHSTKGIAMSRPTQPKRASMVLMIALAVVAGACSATGDTAEAERVDPSEVETTTTSEGETVTTTTAPSPQAGGGPVELSVFVDTLIPGVTYLTNTDVPFSFSVAESEADWWPVVAENWSVTMVFANLIGGQLNGPQLSLGVAEPGATLESVATAMTASSALINYEASEGLFGGRDAIILDGSIEDQTIPRPGRVLTGQDSGIEVLFEVGRSYRSHIFEEGGRVFIVSVDARPDDMALVLAEAAPVFESLQIGDAE